MKQKISWKKFVNSGFVKSMWWTRFKKVDLGNVLDDPSSREFVCPYCSYSFAYKHVLERHVAQIHEKHLLTTLQCPKCTYSTVRKDQMRAHFSVVHEDFKPFNCSECGFRAPKAFRVTVNIASFLLLFRSSHIFVFCDQSIASTKTKYIKLNTKTQILFNSVRLKMAHTKIPYFPI